MCKIDYSRADISFKKGLNRFYSEIRNFPEKPLRFFREIPYSKCFSYFPEIHFYMQEAVGRQFFDDSDLVLGPVDARLAFADTMAVAHSDDHYLVGDDDCKKGSAFESD